MPATTTCLSGRTHVSREGRDDDLGRGNRTYDNFAGIPRPPPFSTLGVIDQAPFYAIEMESGVNGSRGGPRANRHAQVRLERLTDRGALRGEQHDGGATTGVYAIAGCTLGPGMTFGFIAGRHAAGQFALVETIWVASVATGVVVSIAALIKDW